MITEQEINEAIKREIILNPSSIDKLLKVIPLRFKRGAVVCNIIKGKFPEKDRVKSSTVQRMFDVSHTTCLMCRIRRRLSIGKYVNVIRQERRDKLNVSPFFGVFSRFVDIGGN